MVARHYSDETLMAYADGELSVDLLAEIDMVVASDPEVAERVAMFAETRARARDSLPALDIPVPERLAASVAEMVRQATAPELPSQGRRRPAAANSNVPLRFMQAAAAALIAIVAGAGGFVVGTREGTPPPLVEVAATVAPAIAAPLSTLASGQRVPLASVEGEIEIIATFSAGGLTCREFEIDQDDRETRLAIACHNAGTWTTAFAMSRGGGGDDYLPASGTEAAEAYLASISAGPVLDPAQEAAILRTIASN